MRKISTLLFVLITLQMPCLADPRELLERNTLAEKENTMALSLSPLHIFLLSLNGKYSLKVHDRVAVTLPLVMQYIPQNSRFREIAYVSGGLGAQYFFFDKVFKSGLHTEFRLTSGYSQLTPLSTASYSSIFLQTAVFLGYSWAFKSGLAFNLAGGLYHSHAFSDEAPVLKKALSVGSSTTTIASSMFGLTSGFGPSAEFSLAYSW